MMRFTFKPIGAFLCVATASAFAADGAKLSGSPITATPGAVIECRGIVAFVDEVQLPARAAATIFELLADEGDSVVKGQLLGRLDDKQAQADLAVAVGERRVQEIRKQDDSEERSAVASAKVAAAEHAEAVEINRKTPGTLAPVRVRRLRLAETRAELEVEVAGLKQRVNELEFQLSDTKVAVSEERLRLRSMMAPLDGVVARRMRHVGEWVEVGEPVFHIVRMDRLRLEWLAPITAVQPHKMPGLPVSAVIELGQGETTEVKGVIGFVSPLVEASGDYRVWCEFDNRKQNGRWLIRPGQVAVVRIGHPGAAPPPVGKEETVAVRLGE